MRRLLIALFLSLVLLGCEGSPPAECGPIDDVTLFVGESETVGVCFDDPDGDELTISVANQDDDVAFVERSGDGVLVRARVPGTTTVTVTATDPDSLTGASEFSVIVPNRPPVGEALEDVLLMPYVERQVSLAPHFEDPDGQVLTYSASSSEPGIVSVEVSGGILTLTGGEGEGTAEVSATASDGELEATVSFEATIPTILDFSVQEHFDDESSLDDWIYPPSQVEASVANSVLSLRYVLEFPSFAWARRDFDEVDDFAIGVRLKPEGGRARTGVMWSTGSSSDVEEYYFVTGPEVSDDTNWSFWYTEPGSSRQLSVSGNSAAINYGEFDNYTFVVIDDRLLIANEAGTIYYGALEGAVSTIEYVGLTAGNEGSEYDIVVVADIEIR